MIIRSYKEALEMVKSWLKDDYQMNHKMIARLSCDDHKMFISQAWDDYERINYDCKVKIRWL